MININNIFKPIPVSRGMVGVSLERQLGGAGFMRLEKFFKYHPLDWIAAKPQ